MAKCSNKHKQIGETFTTKTVTLVAIGNKKQEIEQEVLDRKI
jgi:hypothetical protein